MVQYMVQREALQGEWVGSSDSRVRPGSNWEEDISSDEEGLNMFF